VEGLCLHLVDGRLTARSKQRFVCMGEKRCKSAEARVYVCMVDLKDQLRCGAALVWLEREEAQGVGGGVLSCESVRGARCPTARSAEVALRPGSIAAQMQGVGQRLCPVMGERRGAKERGGSGLRVRIRDLATRMQGGKCSGLSRHGERRVSARSAGQFLPSAFADRSPTQGSAALRPHADLKIHSVRAQREQLEPNLMRL
jgi:hypothetical protein